MPDEPVILHMDEAERHVHIAHILECAELRDPADVPDELRRAKGLGKSDVTVHGERIEPGRDHREISHRGDQQDRRDGQLWVPCRRGNRDRSAVGEADQRDRSDGGRSSQHVADDGRHVVLLVLVEAVRPATFAVAARVHDDGAVSLLHEVMGEANHGGMPAVAPEAGHDDDGRGRGHVVDVVVDARAVERHRFPVGGFQS